MYSKRHGLLVYAAGVRVYSKRHGVGPTRNDRTNYLIRQYLIDWSLYRRLTHTVSRRPMCMRLQMTLINTFFCLFLFLKQIDDKSADFETLTFNDVHAGGWVFCLFVCCWFFCLFFCFFVACLLVGWVFVVVYCVRVWVFCGVFCCCFVVVLLLLLLLLLLLGSGT